MRKLNERIAKAQIKGEKQLESISKFKGIQLQGLPSQCTKINEQIFQLNESLLKLLLSYLLGRAEKIRKIGLQWAVIQNIDEITQEQIKGVDVLFIHKNEVWEWMKLDKNETVSIVQSKFQKENSRTQKCKYIWSAPDQLDVLLTKIMSFQQTYYLKKECSFINQQYGSKSSSDLKKTLITDLKQCFVLEANQHLQYLKKQEEFLVKTRQTIQNMSKVPMDLPKYLQIQKQMGISENQDDDDQQNRIDIEHPVQILNQHPFYIEKWKNTSSEFNNTTNQNVKDSKDWRLFITQNKIKQLQLNKIWNLLPSKIQQAIIKYISTNNQSCLNNLIIQKDQTLRNWITLKKLSEAKRGVFKEMEGQIKILGRQFLNKQRPDKTLGQIQLTTKFPVQTYKMKRLFDILGPFKDDKQISAQYENVCQILKLDYLKLKKDVESEPIIQNKIHRSENIQQNNTYHNEQTAYQSKSTKNQNLNNNQEVYSIQQIIQQITITQNLNQQPSGQFQQISNVKLEDQIRNFCQETEKTYQSSILHYSQKQIKFWTKSDVHLWADNYRHQKDIKLKDIKLSTIIGILDRANQLITTHRLRNTQKISLWFFLKKESTQGQIGQIKTGQGKTTIISLLAAIKCFQGYRVDIITSNNVLAKQGADQKQQFYKLLGLTAGNNNPVSKNKGERDCYKYDIVYGSISNFQFDYLRHQFQRENTLGNRKISENWLILDQVDSLIIDQGSNIAKLSGPFPGMESLRYVYLNIWAQMAKCQTILYENYGKLQEQRRKILCEKWKNKQINIQQGEIQHQKIQQHFKNNFYDNLLKQMMSLKDQIINKDLMAINTHDFASKRLEKWIENAYLAKYKYQQNNEYKLVQKEGQLEIIPVDNRNTGASMKNTILSNGIHQFLQLKHNLFLTYQSLTSCFISNVAYVKFYGSKISGLTGTLGSNAEMNLLHSIYGIDFFSMPTYTPKKFIDYPGVIVKKDKFNESISVAVLGQVIKTETKAPRAVLIICQTIGTALEFKNSLEQMIKKADYKSIKIKLFTDQNESDVTNQKVSPGDIVIATNISGRGADYKTTKQLQQNGGLHVIVSFLPCNKRVQDQAFGRTSRQGKNGSAQLIISEADILRFGIDQCVDFDEVKDIRDRMESERLQTIKNVKLKQITFQDEIFSKFCNLYASLKLNNKTKFQWIYYLMDLKERWAFWLQQKSYDNNIIKKTTTERQFNDFLSVSNEITKGQICWNPYYSIFIIDKYLSMDMKKQAEKELQRVIDSFTNSGFYYTLFMKGFQLQIMNGNQLLQRYKQALGKILFIYCIQKNQQYKDRAYNYLVTAEKGINIEINYLKSIIDNKQMFQKIIADDESKTPQKQTQTQNILVKHLIGRLMALQIFKQTILTNKSQLKGDKALKYGVVIASRVPKSLSQLSKSDEDQKNITKYISQKQVDQLQFIGMDSVVLLKEIHDVPTPIVISAQIQIAAGLALIGLCIPFPFLLPIKAPLAGVFIGQGITDIVMALIDQGESGFNSSDYIKSKVIGYGIAFLTAGISSIMSSTKILKKAQSCCQKLASKLRNAKRFISICNWTANKLQKLAQYFELMITKINIQRGIDQTTQIIKYKEAKDATNFLQLRRMVDHTTKFNNLSKLGKFGYDIKGIIIQTVTNLSISIVSEKVMSLTLFKIIDLFEAKIRINIVNCIKELFHKFQKRLSLMTEQEVDQRFQLMNLPKDLSSMVFKEILNLIKSNMNWKMQLTIFVGSTCFDIKQLYFSVSQIFYQFIEKKVILNNKNLKRCIVKQVEDRLSNMITIKFMNDLKTLSAKVLTTTVMIAKKWHKEKKEKRKQQQVKREMQERQKEIANAQIKAQGNKCGHQSLGQILGMNSQQIADSSGIGASQHGATIQEMKEIHTKIGIQNAEISSFSSQNKHQIVQQMKEKNSDRGVIFFEKNNALIGHSEPIFNDNGKIRVGSINGPQIKVFMAQKAYSENFKVLLGKNVNVKNIQNLKICAYRNRIQFATNKLQGFVGRSEGIRYGMRILNAEEILGDTQLLQNIRRQHKLTDEQIKNRIQLNNDIKAQNNILQREINDLQQKMDGIKKKNQLDTKNKISNDPDYKKIFIQQNQKRKQLRQNQTSIKNNTVILFEPSDLIQFRTQIDKEASLQLAKRQKQNNDLRALIAKNNGLDNGQNQKKIYYNNQVIQQIQKKKFYASSQKKTLTQHPNDKYGKDGTIIGDKITLHHIIPENQIRDGIYSLITNKQKDQKQLNKYINNKVNQNVKESFLKKYKPNEGAKEMMKNFISSACQNNANISAGPEPHLRLDDPHRQLNNPQDSPDPTKTLDKKLVQTTKIQAIQENYLNPQKHILNTLKLVAKLNIHQDEKTFQEQITIQKTGKQVPNYRAVITKK